MPQKEHFRHRHPLIVDESCGSVKCPACQKRFKGPAYYCYECRYYLHESCAVLLAEIQHFYHSSHSLTLHDIEHDTAVNCDVCQETRPGFTYRCYDCDFKIDVYCAKLQKEIQLSIHPHHPLTLLQLGGRLRYNTALLSWYYKGFELRWRYLVKHPTGVDFLDLEEKDKEMAADEASQSAVVAPKENSPEPTHAGSDEADA